MSFYVYKQNNLYSKYLKPAENVIVEAQTEKEADLLFEMIDGCYFDGIRKKIDCFYCGDRWRRASDYNKYETLEEAKKSCYNRSIYVCDKTIVTRKDSQ